MLMSKRQAKHYMKSQSRNVEGGKIYKLSPSGQLLISYGVYRSTHTTRNLFLIKEEVVALIVGNPSGYFKGFLGERWNSTYEFQEYIRRDLNLQRRFNENLL